MGYQMPEPVTNAIDAILRTLHIREEIQGSGGFQTNPVVIVQTGWKHPALGVSGGSAGRKQMMMKRLLHVSLLGLLAASPASSIAGELDACTVLSSDEIKSALGRAQLAAAKPSRASGGYSDCRFPGLGAGDVRITLSPALSTAKQDFDLSPQIHAEEGKKFERVAGVGDDAYYWDDTIQFRVGNRIVSLWIHRTPRTGGSAAVKGALAGLARRIADRLRAAR